MKTIYVANDGTIFEDKDECKNYEFQKESSSISGLDKYGNLIKPSDDNFYKCVRVIKLDTQEAVGCFKVTSENRGYRTTGIIEPGIYIRSDLLNNLDPLWFSTKELIEFYQEKIDQVTEYEKKLNP